MVKIWEDSGTTEIGLVTLTPEQYHLNCVLDSPRYFCHFTHIVKKVG